MYLDAYAIIVQKDMDGGDSLQREGMYAFGKKLIQLNFGEEPRIDDSAARRPAAESMLDKFEIEPGIYIRHPDPRKWYSNPDTTSRDQLTPVIAYCAAYEDYERLWRLFKATLKRGMFAQNFVRIDEDPSLRKIPDPMPLSLSQFIRAGGWWTAPLYPVLLVLDNIELFGTVLRTLPIRFDDDHWIPRWRMDDDVDDNNIIISHLLAAHYKPTPASELARYIYAVTRNENLGNTVLGEKNAVMGSLRWYHRNTHGGGGNPQMAELYRPLVQRYFSYHNN